VHATLHAAPRDLTALRQTATATPYAGTPFTALALSPRVYVMHEAQCSVAADELTFAALQPHWARPVPDLLALTDDEVR
jgi:hypothetical protein